MIPSAASYLEVWKDSNAEGTEIVAEVGDEKAFCAPLRKPFATFAFKFKLYCDALGF